MFQVRQGFTSAALYWFHAAKETNGNAPAVLQYNGRVNVCPSTTFQLADGGHITVTLHHLSDWLALFSQLRSQQVWVEQFGNKREERSVFFPLLSEKNQQQRPQN